MKANEEKTSSFYDKAKKTISNLTFKSSDLILPILFTIQIVIFDLLGEVDISKQKIVRYIVIFVIWLIYWLWRRDNWLVSIYNLLMFYFIDNDYFDLLTRCFLFYCGSNITYYAIRSKVATISHVTFAFLYAFLSQTFGFRQYRDIFFVVALSLFLPLFIGDIQNELLNVHFYAPYFSAVILLLYEDKVHAINFVLTFLTVFKDYSKEYPTFHNTYYSRKMIMALIISVPTLYYIYTRGIGINSYETSYDALHMIPMILTFITSYLAFVFWNKEYSRPYRYGFSATYSIISFFNSIFLAASSVYYFTESIYKLWSLPPVGNDRSLLISTIQLISSSILFILVHDWRNIDRIHKTIFYNVLLFFIDSISILISYYMMNYLDFYRFDVISRLFISISSFYISINLIHECASDLIINSSEYYKEMYDLIDEWAIVKDIKARKAGGKVVLEAKCRIRDRSRRVGVAANGIYAAAKKMGLDYTVEIEDAPPKPSIVSKK